MFEMGMNVSLDVGLIVLGVYDGVKVGFGIAVGKFDGDLFIEIADGVNGSVNVFSTRATASFVGLSVTALDGCVETGIGAGYFVEFIGFALGRVDGIFTCVWIVVGLEVVGVFTCFLVGLLDGLEVAGIDVCGTSVTTGCLVGFFDGYEVVAINVSGISVSTGFVVVLFFEGFIVVGRDVGTPEVGGAVGFSVGIRVDDCSDGTSVGDFVGLCEGFKVGSSVSTSHQIRSRVPCKLVSDISSSVPPVPKYP